MIISAEGQFRSGAQLTCAQIHARLFGETDIEGDRAIGFDVIGGGGGSAQTDLFLDCRCRVDIPAVPHAAQ